jgi:hypothetical protein
MHSSDLPLMKALKTLVSKTDKAVKKVREGRKGGTGALPCVARRQVAATPCVAAPPLHPSPQAPLVADERLKWLEW